MRDYVIIGSKALAHHYADFPRVPKDVDVVLTKKKYLEVVADQSDIEFVSVHNYGQSSIVKFENGPYVEYFFADGIKSLESLLEFSEDDYASPEVLYSLKKAHINYPIKFRKHIEDLAFLRSKLREKSGISERMDLNSHLDWLDELPLFTELHRKCTADRIGPVKTPKMDNKASDFFGKSKNFVTSYYIHDDMHKAVAKMHEGDPVYEKIIAEGSEVETDLILWSKLDLQQKIWCVLEEVYVIALERKIIPALFEDIEGPMTEKEAFDWALMRVCTTLCDGFFRDFAVKAYNQIQEQYNPDYVELFFKNISQFDTIYDKTDEEN